MSDYVTFHSVNRVTSTETGGVSAPGGDDGARFSEALAGNAKTEPSVGSQPLTGADAQAIFAEGYLAGLQAVALDRRAPSGAGSLIGGLEDNSPDSDDRIGINPLGMDPFGMIPGATGPSSHAMSGVPGFGQNPIAGALNQLNQFKQLLTLVAQLEMLVSEMRGGRGGQSDIMTPIGMPGGNDFMRGGPGSDRLEPEMTILPYDPSGEIFSGNPGVVPGAAPDAPVSPVRDPLDDWYVNGQGDLSERQRANIEAVMTGRGPITLSTDPMTNETDFVQGMYPFDETRDMLSIVNREGMHGDLHREVMWWLSGYGVTQNGLDAGEALFEFEGDDFSNAYMDLMRTPMAEQLGAALDGVAGRQLREEREPSSERGAVEQGDIGESEIYTEYPDDFDGERQEPRVFDGNALSGVSLSDLPQDRDELLRMLDNAVASSVAEDELEEEAA